MEVAATLILNPAIFDYDDSRRKELARFKTAVDRAKFLDEDQKRQWKTLAYRLGNQELKEGQKLIMAENFRHLKTRQKLDKIKPNKDR